MEISYLSPNQVLVEKMGVPDMKARRRIRDAQFAAEYYIDRSTVKLGEQQECIL